MQDHGSRSLCPVCVCIAQRALIHCLQEIADHVTGATLFRLCRMMVRLEGMEMRMTSSVAHNRNGEFMDRSLCEHEESPGANNSTLYHALPLLQHCNALQIEETFIIAVLCHRSRAASGPPSYQLKQWARDFRMKVVDVNRTSRGSPTGGVGRFSAVVACGNGKVTTLSVYGQIYLNIAGAWCIHMLAVWCRTLFSALPLRTPQVVGSKVDVLTDEPLNLTMDAISW